MLNDMMGGLQGLQNRRTLCCSCGPGSPDGGTSGSSASLHEFNTILKHAISTAGKRNNLVLMYNLFLYYLLSVIYIHTFGRWLLAIGNSATAEVVPYAIGMVRIRINAIDRRTDFLLQYAFIIT